MIDNDLVESGYAICRPIRLTAHLTAVIDSQADIHRTITMETEPAQNR